MDVLAEKDGRVYARATIDRPEAFASPFSGAPFVCLIWDHDGRLTVAERTAVAERLLEAGCRYAVCGGRGCEAWHDDIDELFVEAHLDEPEHVSDAAFVLTSWHEGESPDDVAFFFVVNTSFDEHDFRNYLVLHVGTAPSRAAVDSAVVKHVLRRGSD